MGLTGKGTGMVLGTKTCICILTRGTLTRVPTGYTRTHDLPYMWLTGFVFHVVVFVADLSTFKGVLALECRTRGW